MTALPDEPRSMVGRLLVSVSWQNATWYRHGGRGREDVLTLEVLQALDLLPRTAFLGNILATHVHEAADAVRLLAKEIEASKLTLFPLEYSLSERSKSGKTKLRSVQPDGKIESADVLCLLEVKRIKAGSFQPEQLAREFLVAWKYAEAAGKKPLLLLVLPKGPDVRVKAESGTKTMSIREAVESQLARVLGRAQPGFPSVDRLVAEIDSTIAYTTWSEITEAVSNAVADARSGDQSTDACVLRVADTLVMAISGAA